MNLCGSTHFLDWKTQACRICGATKAELDREAWYRFQRERAEKAVDAAYERNR